MVCSNDHQPFLSEFSLPVFDSSPHFCKLCISLQNGIVRNLAIPIDVKRVVSVPKVNPIDVR